MHQTAEQLANEVMALSEDERLGIFLRLASSLPRSKAQLAESNRRAEEMKSGKVTPMSETEFTQNLDVLRGQLRNG